MKTAIKEIIAQALDLKEASIKRAMNTTNKNPAFKPIYQTELNHVAEARIWLNAQKED